MGVLTQGVKFIAKGAGALKIGSEIVDLAIPGAIGKLAKRGAIATQSLAKMRQASVNVLSDDDLVDAGVDSIAEVINRGPFDVDEVTENAAGYLVKQTGAIVAEAGGGQPGANAITVQILSSANAIMKRGQTTLMEAIDGTAALAKEGWTAANFETFVKSATKNSDFFAKLGKILAIAGAAGAALYAMGDELLDSDDDGKGPEVSPTLPEKGTPEMDEGAQDSMESGGYTRAAMKVQQVKRVLTNMHVSPPTLVALIDVLSMPRSELREILSVISAFKR
jgi:hypothetical protein